MGGWQALETYCTAALANLRTSDLAGAMNFDISSYGNDGADDPFDIEPDGAPKAWFTAFVAIAAAKRGAR
jgi:hypothetical protein